MKKMMGVRNKIPSTEKGWLEEISKAYLDACDTIPFGKFVDQKINPEDLFHLGPAVCLKFRGMKKTKSNKYMVNQVLDWTRRISQVAIDLSSKSSKW